MKKVRWLIIALTLSLIGQSVLAEEIGGLVQRSEALTDRLKVSILPGLKQPSRQWYGVSFAPQPTRNRGLQADYAVREKRLLQHLLEPLAAEQPANNLLQVRF